MLHGPTLTGTCVTWPNINRDTTKHVKECGHCQALIYGFNVRGPLEVLRDNWVDDGLSDSFLMDWAE